jgi:hypothetical protein
MPKPTRLGVSPYILGTAQRFSTKHLTGEFKNNLDSLIEELDSDTPKTFGNIDVCICWSQVSDSFKGYQLASRSTKNHSMNESFPVLLTF